MSMNNHQGNSYEQLLAEVEDYAIILLDTEGNILDWNKGAEKIKGYKASEIIGKNFRVFYTPEDRRKQVPEHMLQEAAKKGKATSEGWRLKKDGTAFWGYITITALHDENGNITGFGKITRDLTAQKKEEALTSFNQQLVQKVVDSTEDSVRTDQRFKSIVENSFDAIILLDGSLNAIYRSPAIEGLFGSGLTGPTPWEDRLSYIHPDDLPNIENFRQSLFENPAIPLPIMFRIKQHNGNYSWLEGVVTNLLQDKTVNAIVGNFRDINHRKLAEEKMIRATRLYAVISQVNQTIVHGTNEEDLYKKVCTIATEVGEFDMAWVGLIDESNRTLHMVSESGATDEDRKQFNYLDYGTEGPTAYILRTGENYVSNNLEQEPGGEKWRNYVERRNFKSCCVLPIKKFNQIIGIFSLYSHKTNIFDSEEIALLDEVVNDISFALGVYEQQKLQQKAEQDLLHSEQLLKRAQAMAHLGSWDKDYTTGIVNWSEQMFKLLGLVPSSIVPSLERYMEFVHPADKEQLKSTLYGTGGEFKDFVSNHRVILADDNIRYLYSEAKFDLDLLGNPLHLYGITQDVTNTVHAEEKLVQSERYMRSIIENNADGIVLVNEDGMVVYASPNSKVLLGFEPEEIIGPFRAELIHPDHVDRVMAAYNKVVATPRATTLVEYLSMKKDGTYIWVEGNYSNHFDDRNISAMVVNYRDVTARKRAEENLRKSETAMRKLNSELEERVEIRTDELMHANKELEAFSYTVSHDLRTPIRAIQIFSNLLQSKLVDADPSIQTYLENILKSTSEMNDLIKDLLTFSKLGRQELVKTTVDMNLMVNEVISHLTSLEGNQNTEVNVIPLASIEADATLIRSVWLNLISNAIKYCRKDVACKIVIAYKLEQDNVVYMVKDNGIGFDMKYYDKLFKPFSRLHASSEYKGTGAGLAICDRIITRHGGNIWAESTLKGGSTFFFTLPLNAVAHC